jgi:hypothetical protein
MVTVDDPSCIAAALTRRGKNVRVLDGDRPGYAVLLFDKRVESPSLRLAIKSLQVGQGSYLGPEGSFSRAPHFFVAERVVTPKGPGYRVGPEMVDYLLEDDQIEATSDDAQLTESGFWGAVTPSLSMMPGGGRKHILSGAGAPPVTPPPSFTLSAPPPITKDAPESAPLHSAKPRSKAPEPGPERKTDQGGRKKPPLLAIAIGAAALSAAIAAAALVPGLRCSLLRVGCPAKVDDPSVEIGDSAFACAGSTTACVVEACFTEYLSRFPDAPRAGEARARVAQGKAECLAQHRPAKDSRSSPSLPSSPVEQPRAPVPALAEGVYGASASAVPACGIRADPFMLVTVCGGSVTWRHQAQTATWQWRGSIRSDGGVDASVAGGAGYSATGSLGGGTGEIRMTYPGCGSPVILKLKGQRSSGCAQR